MIYLVKIISHKNQPNKWVNMILRMTINDSLFGLDFYILCQKHMPA